MWGAFPGHAFIVQGHVVDSVWDKLVGLSSTLGKPQTGFTDKRHNCCEFGTRIIFYSAFRPAFFLLVDFPTLFSLLDTQRAFRSNCVLVHTAVVQLLLLHKNIAIIESRETRTITFQIGIVWTDSFDDRATAVSIVIPVNLQYGINCGVCVRLSVLGTFSL